MVTRLPEIIPMHRLVNVDPIRPIRPLQTPPIMAHQSMKRYGDVAKTTVDSELSGKTAGSYVKLYWVSATKCPRADLDRKVVSDG